MSLKSKAFSGLLWTYGQQFSTQILNFIINIILARLLLPSDFGTIGLLYVLISISTVLIEGGLSASLIREKYVDSNDYNTVFIFNIFSALILYFIIYISAPSVENFYDALGLSEIIRVYSLTLIISSFGIVQRVILIKALNFRKEAIINLPSIIISGIIGILLAYNGFGVWSLVWPPILRTFFNVIQLWIYSAWKPNFKFYKDKFLHHFDIGYKYTLTEIIRNLFSNIYPIILGKSYSLKEVGLYKQADLLRLLPYSNIVSSVNKVAFPLFSEINEDQNRVKSLHEKFTVILFVILCPIFVYMALLSKDVITFFLTDKWIDAEPLLTILSFGSLLSVININNLNVLNARGKMKLVLKIEIIDKSFFLFLLAVCLYLNLSLYLLIMAEILRGVVSTLLKDYYCSKELGVRFGCQLQVLFKPLMFTLISGILVYTSNYLLSTIVNSKFLLLLIPVTLGISCYIGLIYLFQKKILQDIFSIFFKKTSFK